MSKPGTYLAGLLVTLAAAACAERPGPNGPAAGSAPQPGGAPTAAAAAASPAPGAPAITSALQFIADDAPLALAEAKRRGVPVFVEAWAPW
jgi:hypothetical protein